MIWVYFLLLALLIGVSGFWLSRTADSIGDALGMSQNWVGAVVLATITSSPELISGITAVSGDIELPELAVGNALGGNVFNLMLVFALDLIYRERTIYSAANFGHVLTAALGVMMMGFVLFFFILQTSGLVPTFSTIGLTSFLLPVLYLLCMKTIHSYEEKSNVDPEVAAEKSKLSGKVLLQFTLSAVGVLIGGLLLPRVGQMIMVQEGWNQAFVGTVFMAMVTSCPELAVSVAAIRLGLVNMALSNLLASNIFNIVIISVDDIFYRKGPILLEISEKNVLTVFSGILMTSLVIVGLVYNPEKRIFNTVSIISILILCMYVLNNVTLFKLGN